jgi:hypothetical protein
MVEKSERAADFGVALGAFALMAALGAFIGAVAVKDFARARASLAWPPVVGVVLSKSAADIADVRYAYVAGGRGHEATRVRFLTGLVFAAPTRDLRPGEEVTVFVDPGDPAFSVLRPGGSGLVFAGAAFGAAAFVFFGVAGIIRTLMNLRKAGAGERAVAAAREIS